MLQHGTFVGCWCRLAVTLVSFWGHSVMYCTATFIMRGMFPVSRNNCAHWEYSQLLDFPTRAEHGNLADAMTWVEELWSELGKLESQDRGLEAWQGSGSQSTEYKGTWVEHSSPLALQLQSDVWFACYPAKVAPASSP